MRWIIVLFCFFFINCSADNALIETGETNPVESENLSDNFVRITTSGSYTMLANVENQTGRGESVNICTEYHINKYAVTNKQWSEFIKATGRTAPRYWSNIEPPAGKENHPVVWVSYTDAVAYCDWLEQKYPGYDLRLPTQAEWEYAAVGEKRTLYPWGNDTETKYSNGILTSKFNYNAVVGAYILKQPDVVATYNNPQSTRYGEKEAVSKIFSINANGGVSGWIDHNCYTGFVYTDMFTEINDAGGYTCAVDEYPDGVSPFGCYNMSGNCWEWTSTVEVATNGAEKGKLVNVIKGGSWYATAGSCKASYRGEGRHARTGYATVGFRVVAEPIKRQER